MCSLRKRSLVVVLAATLLLMWLASPALAAERKYQYVSGEDRNAVAMGFDLILLRPLGAVATVLGTAIFIVSIPFSALGGNTGEAAQALVVAPAKYTFVRPLGAESAE